MFINGKSLSGKDAEFFDTLMLTNPDFRAKVEFLENGGSFREGGVRKVKGKYVKLSSLL